MNLDVLAKVLEFALVICQVPCRRFTAVLKVVGIPVGPTVGIGDLLVFFCCSSAGLQTFTQYPLRKSVTYEW